MRIIIAGSRDFNNYNKLKSETLRIVKELKEEDYNTKREEVEIVSGTARGADQLGERFAKEFNLGLARFPANWHEFGKRAGYLRNSEMSEYAKLDKEIGVLIAFWNGSKGTKHMIDLATKDGLKVYVVKF
ncbi:DUF2493 domain-containing protein [Clostridium sp.]|uniref:DUF2493 domain-containing protein n=1 Tax=Clostridium sp. TaxID=1506 RepID=UPI00257CBB50|nr:DUF2493 domain-containing protein [Clostridium sp.]